MTETIVDLLETIEVDTKDGDLALGAGGIRKFIMQALFKQDAIGQIRQNIVVRLTNKLRMQPLALRDIMHQREHHTPSIPHHGLTGDVHLQRRSILPIVQPWAR